MAEVQSGSSGPAILQDGGDRENRYPLTGGYFEKIRQLVSERWDAAVAHYTGKWEQFYRYEKLIDMVSKKKQFSWKANAFLPYPFAMSELSASMKWLAMFGNRPYITVKPRVGAALSEIADRRQVLLDWHLGPGGDIDLVDTGQRMLRMSERYGKAVALCVPEWEPRKMRYRSLMEIPTALGNISREVWKTRESRDYRIHLIPLDLTDFVIAPGFRRINGPRSAPWCMYRQYMTMEDLLEQQEAKLIGPAVGGEWVQELHSSNEPDSNEFRLRRIFMNQTDDIASFEDKYSQRVEVIHAFMKVPRELIDPAKAQLEETFGRDPSKRVLILGNKKVVLGDYALPYDHGMWPFIEMDCVAEVYDFYGRGKVAPIEHLTYVGNEIMNMRLDNVKMMINGLVGVDGKRMPPGWKKRLVSQPFGVIETFGSPAEIIQRINFGDVTQSSYKEQEQVFSLSQEATGVNETMMGATGGAVRTLGEHKMKAELGSTRLQFELIGQGHQLLGYPYGLSGHCMGLDRQYLPFDTYISVVNPEYPDDFLQIAVDHTLFDIEDHKFQYLPTGVTEGMNMAAKRADLSNMLAVMNPWMADLTVRYGGNFVDEMVKTVLKAFGYDPSRFISGDMIPGVIGIPEAIAQGAGQGQAGGQAGQSGQAPPGGNRGQAGRTANAPPQPYQGGPGKNNASLVSSALGRAG